MRNVLWLHLVLYKKPLSFPKDRCYKSKKQRPLIILQARERNFMSDTPRTVYCAKYQKELPGLAKAPFAGDIGKQIFEKVSEQAWREWRDDMQIKVLNEYRLNMGNKDDYARLVDQMLMFLNLKSGTVSEVENATRGRTE